ncbi:MAG TPA: acetyl-CoA carboxylase biotin carboxyl carrier protein [Abditibacteriaceae bacterium]
MTHPQDSDGNKQQPSDGAAPDEAARDEAAKHSSGDWFSQTETLRALAQLVRDEKLAELDVSRGSARVVLKKAEAPPRPPVDYPAAVFPPPVFPGVGAAGIQHPEELAYVTSEATNASSTEAAPDVNLVTVLSPMVGIFYRAPSPNDPNFVEVGAHVEVGQTLCLVETMKVFNEITCEWDGTVVEVLAENSQLLETGDSLMVIRKS